MSMLKCFAFYLLFILSVVFVRAQDNLPQIILPSPNAASLGIYGQANSNYYNGTADVQIPLYQIACNNYDLPISLNYNTGGIKVDQIASWVGLGWSLEAGGVITRVVNGLPDDVNSGYVGHLDNIVPDSYSEADKEKFFSYAFGAADSQPDEFYFNFPGYSGKFIFNQEGQIIPIPYQDLKFENTGFVDFTITDNKGVKYFFDQKETNYSSVQCDCLSGGSGSVNPGYTSAWYLTKIFTPLGDTLALNYVDFSTPQYVTGKYEMQYIQGGGQSGTYTNYNQFYNGKRLSNIIYKDGRIDFYPGSSRCDLLGDQYLDSIVIRNYNNVPVKKYRLYYKYMFGDTYYNVTDNCQGSLESRLILDKVTELAIDNSGQLKNPYQFLYNAGLPPRLSYAQDSWGFYNMNTASTFIPTIDFLNGSSLFHYEGAYKEPNLDRAVCGSLNEIIFPTGGTQSFEYELNECNSSLVQGLPANFTYQTAATNSIVHDVNPIQFSLNSITDVRITFDAHGYNASTPAQWPVKMILTDDVGNQKFSTVNSGDLSDVVVASLPSGNYYLNFQILNSAIDISSTSGNYYSVVAKWKVISSSNDVKVGGLRIKRITTTELTSGTKNVKDFEYKNQFERSSGAIVSIPRYEPYHYSAPVAVDPTNNDIMQQYYVLSSIPNYIISSTMSGPVGYSQVTEYSSNYKLPSEIGQGGKTEYYFTSPEIYPDDTKNIVSPADNGSYYFNGYDIKFPFGPPTSKDWKRGKLIKKMIYSRAGSSYSLLRKVTYNYDFIPVTTIRPLKVGITVRHNLPSTDFSACWYNYYQIESGYARLSLETDTLFNNSQYLATTTGYSYNAHLLPSIISTVNSKNETVSTFITYPSDYSPGTAFIDNMNNKNLISFPVEKVITKSTAGQCNIISGDINEYSPSGNGLIQDLYTTESAGSIPLSSFKFSNSIAGSLPGQSAGQGYEKDSHYKAKNNYSYNSQGRMVESSKSNDITTSYIWNDISTLPIASVLNSKQPDIAYTSFEPLCKGGWAFSDASIVSSPSITSHHAYSLTGNTLSKNGLSATGTYIVNYWSTSGACTVSGTIGGWPKLLQTVTINGQTWSLFEHEVTGSTGIALSGNGIIDELRLYPKGALMTTYTYDSLIGITSRSDANHRITYYEYDGLGRLQLIRDQNQNILKKYDYKYASQQ